MPIYAYRCDVCNSEFEVRHGMFFVQEQCIKCHARDCLERLPSLIEIGKIKAPSNHRPGKIVDEYIEEVKEEIKKEKKEMKNLEVK